MTIGRPKLSPERKRSEHLVVCLSPAEKRAIEEAAQGQPSVWAREVLLAAAAATAGATPPAEGAVERNAVSSDQPPNPKK